MRFEYRGTGIILVLLLIMDSAIEFNRDPPFRAGEVEDERAAGSLPTKL